MSPHEDRLKSKNNKSISPQQQQQQQPPLRKRAVMRENSRPTRPIQASRASAAAAGCVKPLTRQLNNAIRAPHLPMTADYSAHPRGITSTSRATMPRTKSRKTGPFVGDQVALKNARVISFRGFISAPLIGASRDDVRAGLYIYKNDWAARVHFLWYKRMLFKKCSSCCE